MFDEVQEPQRVTTLRLFVRRCGPARYWGSYREDAWQKRSRLRTRAFRDAGGRHLKDEWTAISDIGCEYDGVVLTREAYQPVEDAYVTAAESFLNEAGAAALTVASLAVPKGVMLDFRGGDTLRIDRIRGVARRVQTEEFWCRLEAEDDYVHFGYGYYMHIGVSHPCRALQRRGAELGVFVENVSLPAGRVRRVRFPAAVGLHELRSSDRREGAA